MRVSEQSDKRTATVKADGKHTLTRMWTVVAEEGAVGPLVAANADGIPSLREPYVVAGEFEMTLRVASKSAVVVDGHCRTWEVQVNYDTEVDEFDNPLQRPPKWSMSFAAYTRVAERDIDGEVLENSAGMQHNPPVEIDDSRPIIRVVRNVPKFDIGRARFFKDAINITAWKGQPPRTVKVKNITSGEIQKENDIEFYAETTEFELSEEGEDWTYELLDAGFYELDDNGVPRVLLDAAGQPYQEPVKLDGDGKRLKPGADPFYKQWFLLKERDLNLMGL